MLFTQKIRCLLFPTFLALLSPLFGETQRWDFLKAFEEDAEKSRQECQAVGMAIAIIKDGHIVYLKGFGQRALDDQSPVTEETLFQIGSMSKSFTSALTALAVDQKYLKWDDPVINHFSTFQLNDPWVTRNFQVEDLFAQRSGLVPYAGDNQALLGVLPEKMMANLHFFSPITSFRSTFAYENIFFLAGAQVLLNKTGKTWRTLVEEKLFKPLGMKGASTSLADYLKAPNRAGWHIRRSNGVVERIPDSFESANWVYLYAPAGGINATILDMAQWIIMQSDLGQFKGKQIVSKESLSCTHRPHVFAGGVETMVNYYCLGWLKREYSPYPILWHNGATSGVNNNMAIIPEEHLGIVILCNTRDTVVAEALTWKFFDLYYGKEKVDWTQKMLNFQREKDKKDFQKKESFHHLSPSLALTEYAGVYINPVYGKMTVQVKGDHLEASLGPRPTQWILTHFNRDTFTLLWPWVDETESKVIFSLGDDNLPQRIYVEMLEAEGQPLFERVRSE